MAIVAGRFGATDGEKVVTGDASDLVALAADLGGRPLVAHDAKGLGGEGGTGLLSAAEESLDLAHDTMVAAYLIDPARRVYALHELAADAGPGRRARQAPTRASSRWRPRRARRRATPRSTLA